MNDEHITEEHIVAAIITSGLINQDRGNVVLNPADAIELYEQCRVALAQSEHALTTEVRL